MFDTMILANLTWPDIFYNFMNQSKQLFFQDIFSKYTLFVSLKDRKGIAITNAFQRIFDESNRKPNKIW